MKQLTYCLIVTSILIISSCSKSESPEPISDQFDNFVNKIMGYHIVGQEDTWFNQNEDILNIYEDALTFHSTDSLSVAYIGFGYGNDDLSNYYVTRPNYASWKILGNKLTLKLEDGTSQVWKIMEIKNEYITFKQESTNAIFSMKTMD